MKQNFPDLLRLSAIAGTLSLLVACGGGEVAGINNTAPITPISPNDNITCPMFIAGDSFNYNHKAAATLNQSVSSALQPIVDALLNAKSLNFTSTVTVDTMDTIAGTVNMSETYSGDVTGTDALVANSTVTDFSVTSLSENASKQAVTTYAGTGLKLCVPPVAGDVFNATVTSGGTTQNAQVTIDQVGTQSITTVAGVFSTARRIDSTLRILDSTGTVVPGTEIVTKLWFDDVIGEVASETSVSITVSDNNGTYNAILTTTQELSSYTRQ